jgi:hypothetical protein
LCRNGECLRAGNDRMTYDRTAMLGKYFDRQRARLNITGPLKLFEKRSGPSSTEPLLTIEYGWLPTKERNRGAVETLYVVEVTEREELTQEIVSRTDRMEAGGIMFDDVTWEAPDREPRLWVFYGREVKTGALKR